MFQITTWCLSSAFSRLFRVCLAGFVLCLSLLVVPEASAQTETPLPTITLLPTCAPPYTNYGCYAQTPYQYLTATQNAVNWQGTATAISGGATAVPTSTLQGIGGLFPTDTPASVSSECPDYEFEQENLNGRWALACSHCIDHEPTPTLPIPAPVVDTPMFSTPVFTTFTPVPSATTGSATATFTPTATYTSTPTATPGAWVRKYRWRDEPSDWLDFYALGGSYPVPPGEWIEGVGYRQTSSGGWYANSVRGVIPDWIIDANPTEMAIEYYHSSGVSYVYAEVLRGGDVEFTLTGSVQFSPGGGEFPDNGTGWVNVDLQTGDELWLRAYNGAAFNTEWYGVWFAGVGTPPQEPVEGTPTPTPTSTVTGTPVTTTPTATYTFPAVSLPLSADCRVPIYQNPSSPGEPLPPVIDLGYNVQYADCVVIIPLVDTNIGGQTVFIPEVAICPVLYNFFLTLGTTTIDVSNIVMISLVLLLFRWAFWSP